MRIEKSDGRGDGRETGRIEKSSRKRSGQDKRGNGEEKRREK